MLGSAALRISERGPGSVQTGFEFGLGRGQSGQVRARTIARLLERLLRRCQPAFEIGLRGKKRGLFGFGCGPRSVEILLGGTQRRQGFGKAIFEFGLCGDECRLFLSSGPLRGTESRTCGCEIGFELRLRGIQCLTLFRVSATQIIERFVSGSQPGFELRFRRGERRLFAFKSRPRLFESLFGGSDCLFRLSEPAVEIILRRDERRLLLRGVALRVFERGPRGFQFVLKLRLGREQRGPLLAGAVTQLVERLDGRRKPALDFSFCSDERGLLRFKCRLRLVEALLIRAQDPLRCGEPVFQIVLRGDQCGLLLGCGATRVFETLLYRRQRAFEFRLPGGHADDFLVCIFLRLRHRGMKAADLLLQFRRLREEHGIVLLLPAIRLGHLLARLRQFALQFRPRSLERRVFFLRGLPRFREALLRRRQLSFERGFRSAHLGDLPAGGAVEFHERLLRLGQPAEQLRPHRGKSRLFLGRLPLRIRAFAAASYEFLFRRAEGALRVGEAALQLSRFRGERGLPFIEIPGCVREIRPRLREMLLQFRLCGKERAEFLAETAPRLRE